MMGKAMRSSLIGNVLCQIIWRISIKSGMEIMHKLNFGNYITTYNRLHETLAEDVEFINIASSENLCIFNINV